MLCKKCAKALPEGALWCCWCGTKQKPAEKKTRYRAHGTGSVSFCKRCRKWRAIAPPAIKGRHGKQIGTFETRKAAENALFAYMSEKRSPLHAATLSRIYELWSCKHFEHLTDSGKTGYTSAYSDLAELHGVAMKDIKTADFQRCIDIVAQRYSRSKCEKVRQLCSQLCKYAMQNDIISKNYAEFIVLPKAEKKEKTIFTAAERRTLWAHADENRVRFILFMIYTGFRVGEVSEILPENVHLDEGYILGGLKTEAGRNRVVPLPPSIPEIADFVRAWIADPGSAPFGVPANSLRQYWFYPALASLGMIDPPVFDKKNKKQMYQNPRLTPHATRHTFASLSAAAGMPPEVLQKIIGHADFATTADIYVHSDLAALSAGMSLLHR